MSKNPNILMIICHDIGRHLGCYGAKVKTPNLDRLAGGGVLMENYFCTAPQCSPSRGSIMTGKYPHKNGLIGLAHLGWELNEGEKTLPEYMNESGYETFLFGVQHETAEPGKLGYKHMYPGHEAGKTFIDMDRILFSGKKESKPFYASVGLFEPHRLGDGSFGNEKYGALSPEDAPLLPYLPDLPGIRKDIAGLNAMVEYVDDFVGRCMNRLQETGLDDTLVLFTTDHGIAMPRAKGTLYDPGIGTALIMHRPGEFQGGRVYSELLSNVDLLPTLAEYAGLGTLDDVDGKSFLPLLKGEKYSPRDCVFAELTYHCQYNPQRAIRTKKHKYIKSFSEAVSVYLPADIYEGPAGRELRDEYYSKKRAQEELYDLEKDPLEQDNLISEPAYLKDAAYLSQRLHEWMKKTKDKMLDGAVPPSGKQKTRINDSNNPEWKMKR